MTMEYLLIYLIPSFLTLLIICDNVRYIFIKDVMAIVAGILMFIFNVYFGFEVLGDHSWFYLLITYATRYVYMFIEGSIPVTLTLAIYIIIKLLLAVLLFKGFKKWSGRTIKD